MPLTREQKESLVADYAAGVAAAPHVFLLGFKGITVPQATELRNRLRATGSSYVVIKNRLALRAIEGVALEGLREHFVGPTAAAFTSDNPVDLAKTLTEFAKEVPALDLKAGLVEGQQVGAEEIREIAQLPGREQLIAKLLFLLQSPMTRLTRTLSEVRRQFVGVLAQIAEQRGG